MDPYFICGLCKSIVSMVFIAKCCLLNICTDLVYFVCAAEHFDATMYAMVGHHSWGHYCVPFGLSSHSRSLTAPNSTNKCSNTPLEIMLYICVWNIHKNPSYCETSPDGSLEKIQICALGKSFLFFGENPNLWVGEILLVGWVPRMLNNRGWMIPVTTLSPKLSLPICNQQHHTLLLHAYHILLRYANFSALHIDYTESENSTSTFLALYLVNHGTWSSVTFSAICPDVLAWRDTGSSGPRPSLYHSALLKTCIPAANATVVAKHSTV